MHHQWILDVLNDLRVFAKANGLAALAEQLDDTSLVAASEIAQARGLAGGGLGLEDRQPGTAHHRLAAGDDA